MFQQWMFMAVVTAALVAGATDAPAQSRRIEGIVADEEGRPVAAATITVAMVARFCVSCASYAEPIDGRGTQVQAVTDQNGRYSVVVAGAGVYMVAAERAGAGTAATQVTLPGSFGQSTPDSMRVPFVSANLVLRNPAIPPVADNGRCVGDASPQILKSHVFAAASAPDLARLLEWLEAVGAHLPGCRDGHAAGLARFTPAQLDGLVRDVRELVKFLQRVRGSGRVAGQSSQATFSAYGREFTLDQLERVFYSARPLTPNGLLRRAAVLHADIALLYPGDLNGEPLVGDGGRAGWRAGTRQWEIGRQLLDAIVPRPAADAGARLWYRAVSAYLLSGGRLAEALTHLTRSRQVFPDDPAFLVDSAFLHQKFSSPSLQASADALRADGIEVNLQSRTAELRRAERFFQQALVLAPADTEARLRHAHTLSELGDQSAASIELHQALDGNPDRRQRYLAELFLGRVKQKLDGDAEAARHYANAAALYPSAQSPRWGLSQLARQSGDVAGALRIVTQQLEPAGRIDDPWFDYYQAHADDADALLEELRSLADW